MPDSIAYHHGDIEGPVTGFVLSLPNGQYIDITISQGFARLAFAKQSEDMQWEDVELTKASEFIDLLWKIKNRN